jgi:cytosolic carboxypeptidase protein 1
VAFLWQTWFWVACLFTLAGLLTPPSIICELPCATPLLSAGRVHPGESNASWIMKGILDFLTSDAPEATELRRRYVFKVVPMLNPDGVANGSHRCSLAGVDLNRRWKTPSRLLTPTVYWSKSLLHFLKTEGKAPLVTCDFHGHSRKKMVFMYGCNDYASRLPRSIEQHAPAFSFKNCSFSVTPDKESSCRVVIWREIGTNMAYTLESTYSGFDRGPYKGFQVTTPMLEDMGRDWLLGLLYLQRF